RLPTGAVAFEVAHQRGVDVVVFHRPQQDRRHQTAVLALLVDLGIGGAGEDDVLADPLHLGRRPLAPEEEAVDLGFPRPEAGAGPRAVGAAFVAVGATAGAALLLE